MLSKRHLNLSKRQKIILFLLPMVIAILILLIPASPLVFAYDTEVKTPPGFQVFEARINGIDLLKDDDNTQVTPTEAVNFSLYLKTMEGSVVLRSFNLTFIYLGQPLTLDYTDVVYDKEITANSTFSFNRLTILSEVFPGLSDPIEVSVPVKIMFSYTLLGLEVDFEAKSSADFQGRPLDILTLLILWVGTTGFAKMTIGNYIMMSIGLLLIYFGIVKDYEPLLLLPIGFGAILINLPAGLMNAPTTEEPIGGFLWYLYQAGIFTELFPILIFVGIGAMTDFGPLLENPKLLLLGAAGQLGIFLTLMIILLSNPILAMFPALGMSFTLQEAASIAIIGAADGPSAIYLTSKFAPHLLGPITVCAYSYMALVPLIQPPVARILVPEKYRKIRMDYGKPAPKATKILFPIIVTLLTCLIAPMAAPLMGSLMLGNFLRESGVVERLSESAQNEIANIVTLLLGITIGATMTAEAFLQPTTLLIYGAGLFAFIMATAGGLILAWIMYFISRGKVNPLVGMCGISAFPMSARVCHAMGRKADPENFLIAHAMGANTGGQIGSVAATGVLLLLIPLLAGLLL
ncbi:MAG: sodium ion-translocating decarboxylase subunit beta [Candidatus Hodarchaeota archaeon]